VALSVSPVSAVAGSRYKPMSANEDLGHAIRRLRETRQLTIGALARNAGIFTAHLGVIERGHGNPRLGPLFGLADALEVTWEQLVRGT
jgi:transcriptional regulator with XRE-family HTH domain